MIFITSLVGYPEKKKKKGKKEQTGIRKPTQTRNSASLFHFPLNRYYVLLCQQLHCTKRGHSHNCIRLQLLRHPSASVCERYQYFASPRIKQGAIYFFLSLLLPPDQSDCRCPLWVITFLRKAPAPRCHSYTWGKPGPWFCVTGSVSTLLVLYSWPRNKTRPNQVSASREPLPHGHGNALARNWHRPSRLRGPAAATFILWLRSWPPLLPQPRHPRG